MLLRAMQFHARVEYHLQDSDPVPESLASDGYVGLYASCNRLLDALGSEQGDLHEPYARLFVAYAREAIHAQDHLRAIDATSVPKRCPQHHRRDMCCSPWRLRGIEIHLKVR